MTDEQQEHGDGPLGRRRYDSAPLPPPSPWRNPQTYISIVLAILTIGTILWNRGRDDGSTASTNTQILKELSALSAKVDTTNLRVEQTNSGMIQLMLKGNDLAKDVEFLKKRVGDTENGLEKTNTAIQYALMPRLSYLEAKTGYKAPTAAQPQGAN